jgi:prepilin-type N-terminal cleavage/methylation domain-containing protein
MRGNKGFTMIEVLIVIVIGAIVGVGLMYVLSSSRRTSRLAQLDSQAQQNARVAVDVTTKDMRSAGYNLDKANGQDVIVYAGPYELIFNANVAPEPDDASIPGYPAAINIASSPARVPSSGVALYAPPMSYQTGAETMRYTFDSNNDGVIDAADNGDETIEQTPNPYDLMLIRQVYGFDGRSNGGANEQIALLRGPDPDATGGVYPLPLFTYWYDHDDDESTADQLWGDGSGNGEIEQGEIAGLTPVTSTNLPRITRVGITATGTARSIDLRHSGDEGFRDVIITSEVSVRRSKRSSAAFIRGVVFDDLNGDGARQSGESGLGGVTVRLNTGATKTTDAAGLYAFRVDPGAYTVTETDPVGYNSTTPNSVVVTATRGVVALANFGDRAIGGYGAILGKVILYEDEGGEEPQSTGDGIAGVEIFLDTGDRDTTDVNGAYIFLVPISTYSITMQVPSGYLAVGPTTVDRALAAEGDTAMVNFGLMVATETGTIAGKVFEDEPFGGNPPNGLLDLGESGIASVTLRLSNGDSTLTDAEGDYSFTVMPGTYDITQEDLGGYLSTTPNHVTGLVVETDSTVTVNFGDMLASALSFTVITLGETQRALCITSTDLNEFKDPGNNDPEIILGTKYVSGVSNLNVWKNEWKNQSTPNSDIFSQDPWYSRTPGEDILSVDAADIDDDGTNDVITGLTNTSGKVLVWLTQTNGNKAGELADTPTSFFISTGIADVLSAGLYSFDLDGDMDVIIGTEYSYPLGRMEVWFNDGSGNYSHDVTDIYEWAGLHLLNTTRSVAVGNVYGSPAQDVVLGTATGINTGEIQIFRDNGSPNGKFTHHTTLSSHGEVNAVVLRDMLEDSNGDLDIIAGTTAGVGLGCVELWHNNGDGTFGIPDSVAGTYAPSDTIYLPGEVLCLGVERIGEDVYPDVVVGLKRAASYSGEIRIFQTFGYLPSADNAWISPDIGEVITITINDFNKDYRYDFAVGTRTSLSHGHVVVFFNET